MEDRIWVRRRTVVGGVVVVVLAAIWFVRSHPKPWDGLASVPPVEVQSLLAVVDPDVVYTRREVPAASNAWPLLIRAESLAPRKGTREYFAYDSQNLPDAAPLTEAERKAWDPAADAVLAALDRPYCQSPVPTGSENEDRSRVVLRMIGKVLVGKGRERLQSGDLDGATRYLIGCRRLGVALCNCDGQFTIYLAGVSVGTLGDRAIQRAIVDKRWKPAQLRKLLTGLTAAESGADGLDRTLQVEYTCLFLPKLASIVSFKDWWTSPVEADPTGRLGRDLDKAMAEVLAGSPNPFDRLETAKESSKLYAECIRNVRRSWRTQAETMPTLIQWHRGWPDRIVELVGEEAADTRTELRRSLRGRENALGKVFVTDWGGVFDGAVLAGFRYRATTEATRIMVAARLYAAENGGALPEGWAEFVSHGYLASAPIDPFSSLPFRYDPNRRIFWSYGANGVDDNGKPQNGTAATTGDIVWPILPGGERLAERKEPSVVAEKQRAVARR